MKIINQGQKGNCKWASWLHAMAIMGIIGTEKTQELYDNLPDVNLLTNDRALNYFDDLYPVKTQKVYTIQIKWLLNRGIPIIVWVNGYNQESIQKPPYIMRFEDRIGAHSFVIVERQGDLLKCLNSWWPDVCDHGYFYIHKSDVSKIWFKCILIPKK